MLFRFPGLIHGVLLIKDGVIEEVVPFALAKLDEIAEEYVLEDLGNLCVFPGIVDINVAFNADGATYVTRQAASGGVTTIATTDTVTGDLFTDIAKVQVIHDQNLDEIQGLTDIFAYKAYLVPQGPSSQTLEKNLAKALEAVNDTLLIIHPELATPDKMFQATPYRMAEPEQRVFTGKIFIESERTIVASQFNLESSEEEGEIENSESCSEDFTPDINISEVKEENNTNIVVSEFDAMHLSVPELDKEREKKRISLPNLFTSGNTLEVPVKSSPRHHSVQCPVQQRPVPQRDIPFIAKGISVEQAYHDHISNFPIDWEISAITKIFPVNPYNRIHFSNVCSSEAIDLINIHKQTCKITCETSLPYLYFSENDVKPGDTRYKLNPPIRDYQNNKNLWSLLKNNSIDCVTSYHQPVLPHLKIIGDFKKAVNGVASIGFTLQALWTKLRTQVSDENEILGTLGQVLSTNPAKLLKIAEKGGISKGKSADFLVWDPEAKFVVTTTQDKFPDMSPLLRAELYGCISRTYLRGNLIFSDNGYKATGQVLHPLNNYSN